MSVHGIDQFNFEYWQGPAPAVPQQHVMAHNRPGADDVALLLLGTWGEPFEVTLTSHHASMMAAAATFNQMRLVVGSGWLAVKYADLNYTGLYATGYHAVRVEQVNLQLAALLIGPGYSYTNGVVMQTRWTLQPEKL